MFVCLLSSAWILISLTLLTGVHASVECKILDCSYWCVYIGDLVVKFINFQSHLLELEHALEANEVLRLNMNATKCMFRDSTRNFMGFIVHIKGIEVDENKVKTILILEAREACIKNELLILYFKVILRYYRTHSIPCKCFFLES